MLSLRNHLEQWSWRIAVLALPWQTRWFYEGVSLNGFPWENGRWSFYLSWLPMLVTVMIALCCHSEQREESHSESRVRSFASLRTTGAIGAGLFLIASFFTIAPIATLQWWIEVVLLASFVAALVRLHVSPREFASWFVIALIPHALLGFQQYITQTVIGSKWLGIAAQLPATPGVSVVEYTGGRFLRAYGVFPHPNIFGAWLAIGSPLALWLAATEPQRRRSLVWLSISGFLTLCLALTFARASWLAFMVGLVLMFHAVRRQADVFVRILVATYALVIFTLFAGFLFLNRDLVAPRFSQAPRLERLSINERTQSLKDGWTIFTQHPLVGVGPGAADLAVSSLRTSDRPPVPPHAVPLLMLDEVGLLGVLGLVLLLSAWRTLRPRFSFAIIPVISLVVLSFFDHYAWSTWSGMALVALCLSILFLKENA